jgi:hexokinase
VNAQPEPGDMHEDITRELQRLFPADRMQRIVDGLGLAGTEEDLEYIGDLISAVFTRGIEFGAVEVAAQQIEAGAEVHPQIEIAHVDLP